MPAAMDHALLANLSAEVAGLRTELADVRRWRSLFPLLRCRRPSEYAPLVLDAQQTMRAKL